jgi:hypothetical protein
VAALMKTLGHLLLAAALTLAGMWAALVAVNLIPNDRLLAHVRSSISATNYQQSQFGLGKVDFFEECVGATLGLGDRAQQLSVVMRSFLSPVIGNCDEFQEFINGKTDQGFNYWRYWHGYQILSRPLLYRFTLAGVHYVVFALFLLSGVFFVSQVWRISSGCGWSLVIAFLCVPIVDQLAMLAHAMVWIIAFSVGGWLLLPSKSSAPKGRNLYLWFLVLGMLCCYFDLFTVPLVSLTIPLVGLYWKGELSEGEKLTVRSICLLSVMWLAGYSICWSTKWLIVFVINGRGAMTDLANVIQHRIGVGGSPMGDNGQYLKVSALRSILINAKACWYGWLIVGGLAIARIRPLARALSSFKQWSFSGVAVPLVLFGMPLVWLAVMQQHSIWHSWFVARIYFTSFAIMIAWILEPRLRPGYEGQQPRVMLA